MDSTMFPIPGQDMTNARVMMKVLPNMRAVLSAPPSTDPQGLINAIKNMAAEAMPAQQQSIECFLALEAMKLIFNKAKDSPVYKGRPEQEQVIEEIDERIIKMQKYLYHTVKLFDKLAISNLDSGDVEE